MSGVMLISGEVRDITPDVTDEYGTLKVMPASYYAGTSVAERGIFCVRHGAYTLPTTELISFLKDLIGDRSCLEIGSGNGVLAAALGMRATDNYMQQMPGVKELYEAILQQPVRYGANVENIDALKAVRKYKPRVVLGSWITHKYRANAHQLGGNQFGPDERELIQLVDQYILIGNTKTHALHPLMRVIRTQHEPDWLYSRAFSGRNFIAIWDGKGLLNV